MDEQEVAVEESAFDYEGQEIEASTRITDLPPQWKTVRIEEIATELGSGLTPRGGEKSYQQNGIPLIRSQNVLMNQLSLEDVAYISPQTHQSMARSSVVPGDVLLNITGASIGRVTVVPHFLKTANVNQHVCRIRVHSHAYPEFVAYFLSSPSGQSQILGSQFGTTRQGLNYGNVRALRLPLPPPPEQRAIAHTLRTVQETIQARRREADLERERKGSLMQHLFTFGTRGEPTKQTEIGEMPGSWQVAKLGELLREPLKNGHSARESNTHEGIRTLTLTAVTQNNFSLENTKITVADVRQVRDLWLRPGDIFIERANTYELVGLAAIYDGPEDFAIYPDLLIRVRVKEDRIHPRFALEFFLSNACRAYFRKNATGTAGNMPKIDHGTVGHTPMPLPSFAEQQQIAEAASVCAAKIITLEQETALLEELFRALLEELMTGRLSTRALVAAISSLDVKDERSISHGHSQRRQHLHRQTGAIGGFTSGH